jgi:DNA-binding MarR family transcriptional regulator
MCPSSTVPDRYADVPLSGLLPRARATYEDAVRRALRDAGCDDLPPAGTSLITTMHWADASLEAVVRWRGVTKQAVGQTVETLVVRGYLERERDLADRRRVNLTLSERGEAAGRAARRAIDEVDRELGRRVGPRRVAGARATMIALLEMGRAPRVAGDGRRSGPRTGRRTPARPR